MPEGTNTNPDIKWDGKTWFVTLPVEDGKVLEAKSEPGLTYVIRIRQRGTDQSWSFGFETPIPSCTFVDLKPDVALGLGLAVCQKGLSVGFITAAALVHELIEAVDERRLQRLQKQLVSQDLLIIDELGFVPLSKTGAELLFEIISQRYERGSIIITSNLPFDEWTGVFGAERLTGAILDRLTHHVHILEMNGESYRLRQSKIAKP